MTIPLPVRTSAAPRTPLPALTGLRFIAGLQVLIFHCGRWEQWALPKLAKNVALSGYVAVSLFFVLSGFILTYVHGTSSGTAERKRDFYATRFARIYPVYALGLLLAAPFYFGHAWKTHGMGTVALEAPAVLTLLQAHVPPFAGAWNPPGWSLSAEAFFYALFPFVTPGILKLAPSRALALGAVSFAVCMAFPLAYLAIAPDGPEPVSYASETFWISALRYHPLARVPEFVMGIALGRLWLDAEFRSWLTERSAPVSVGATLVLVAALAGSSWLPYPVLHNGLLAPLFALLIVALAAGRGPIAYALSRKPMLVLGEASYSLYILHVPLLMIANKLFGRHVELFGSVPFRVALMATAIAASVLCNRLFEVPMVKIVKKAWKGRAG